MPHSMNLLSLRRKASILLRTTYGAKCWHVPTGNLTFPAFSLHLGKRVPRKNPLISNTDQEFQKHHGEFSIYVWCSWRISHSDHVLASSDDNSRYISSALRTLKGRSLLSSRIFSPAWDLRLVFENNITIDVFCDMTSKSPSYPRNWNINIHSDSIWAGPGNVLEVKGKRILRVTKENSVTEKGQCMNF